MATIGIAIQYSLDGNSIRKNANACGFTLSLAFFSFIVITTFVAHHIFYPAPTPEIVVVPIIVPSVCSKE